MVINEVFNLPSTISVSFSNQDNTYDANESGCFSLYGNPSNEDVGHHDLIFDLTYYCNFNNMPMPVQMNLQGYNLIIEENIDSCNLLLNAEIYNSESPSCNGAILINEISGGSGNYSWDLVNYAWESYEYYNLCEGYYDIEVFDNEYNCSKIFSFYIGITDISFSLNTSELNYVYAGNSNTNWLGFTGNIPEEFGIYLTNYNLSLIHI